MTTLHNKVIMLRAVKCAVTLLTCVCGISSSPLRAQGDASPSVGYLTHFSKAIIVGTGTPADARDGVEAVNIDVLRVIKGSDIRPNTQIRLEVAREKSLCGVPADATPVTGLWFIDVDNKGNLAFASSPKTQACTPLTNSYEVPASPPLGRWYYEANASPEDKLGYELAASLEDHQGKAPLAAIRSAALLDGTTVATRRDISRKLAESDITPVRMLGTLGLVRLADQTTLEALAKDPQVVSMMPLAATAIQHGKEVKLAYNTGTAATFETELVLSLRSIASANEKVINALDGILTSQKSTESIKLAAAHALRNVHTAKAASDLAPLLYDDKPALRAEAISGIACYVNGVPVLDPSEPNGVDLNQPATYKNDETVAHFAMGVGTIAKREDYYLNYWRDWWSLNGETVQAQIP